MHNGHKCVRVREYPSVGRIIFKDGLVFTVHYGNANARPMLTNDIFYWKCIEGNMEAFDFFKNETLLVNGKSEQMTPDVLRITAVEPKTKMKRNLDFENTIYTFDSFV